MDLASHFKGFAFDEAHALMHDKSQRTKAAASILEDVARDKLVMMLTGTPVLNRPIELLPLLRMMGVISDERGSQRTTKWFKNRYCWDDETRTYNGSRNEQELSTFLRANCMIRRTKDQVLTELPNKQRTPVWIELDPEAKRLYRALAAEGYESAQKTNAQAIVYLNALRAAVGEAKIRHAVQWARDFHRNSGRKLVIFADHINVQHRIIDSLTRDGYNVVSVLGGMSPKAKDAAVVAFQTDPNVQFIVCSLKAAGTGLTLTAASDVLTVEERWNPGEHTQAEDRIHRIGQTAEAVNAWYLLALDTVDEWSFSLIENKRKITDAIHDGAVADAHEASSLAYMMQGVAQQL